MATLSVEVGSTALASEHARLLRTALRRGDLQPEKALEDAVLEQRYSTESLSFARRLWTQRMIYEHNSAAVFSRLLPQLMEAEATLDIKTSVLRMSMDELRHAAICAGVVKLLGGSTDVEADLITKPLPEHRDVSAKLRALRNVMFVGCFSETIAVAALSEECELVRESAISAVLEQLRADEILHGKLGWAYLHDLWPTLDGAEKEAIDVYLPIGFGYLEAEMIGDRDQNHTIPGSYQEEIQSLGCSVPDQSRGLLYDTIDTVIIPQLDALGLHATRAWQTRKTPNAG